MRRNPLALSLCAVALTAGVVMLTAGAGAQSPAAPTTYARLQITGDDAVLFTESRIVKFEGPKSRDDMPVENSKGLRAVVPLQIIHLNHAARFGWEVIGPADPDADEFLLRRR